MNEKFSSVFTAFLDPAVDRPSFIGSWLRAKSIPYSVVEIKGKKHIFIKFGSEAYDPRFKMKTLVAHHDRVNDTEGANDNSAACFQLLKLAETLSQAAESAGPRVHNTRIILTDGEEAAGTRGILAQGSFALGSGFRKLGFSQDEVFVLDACGRGDTLIVSTAGLDRKMGKALADKMMNLHAYAKSIARSAAPESWLALPTPYSDNAGFLAAGIAAQTITVLPSREATALLAATRDFALQGAVLEAVSRNRYGELSAEAAAAVPQTWKLMHTAEDTASTLNAGAFSLIERFLARLTETLEPAL